MKGVIKHKIWQCAGIMKIQKFFGGVHMAHHQIPSAFVWMTKFYDL